MVTVGMSCIKYLLFSFNFLFALAGIGLIVAGACVLKDVSHYNNFLEESTLAPPIVLLVAGSIIFIISFLGCCGALRESYNMLIAFAVLLIILLVIEIIIGVYAAVTRESFGDRLKESMEYSLNNYDPTSVDDRRLWAQLQSNLECCGVNGPGDWKMGGLYPAACCRGSDPMSQDDLCGPSREKVFQDGCYEKLRMKIKDGSLIIIGVCIGIAAIEVAGVILSCILASAIKREREERDKE